MSYERWQLWVPFLGTLITAILTIRSNRNQYNKSEKFKEELASKQNHIFGRIIQGIE
ncbi:MULTISPECIES: hypothetical protein [unclassified Enterococcus]|uniref:hypothetical protein n=1 Tax=unclassified Enterococcus TaxID=2608891 RepID=UPI001551DF57|nr:MULTISPECIES: hypothetical protein [unclassified Enterococcus]MBS7577102.1 hypothetical protein [Enterococcus sp. MMGLQ5-2]MBS7584451.1 hypothetical protein [Enterococcus sp. MMGLQ5-1]NPD12306.1 hypothetical protein [Enterococcus sp. MMGLQ5-1]NPD36936.1 hypothetical protein [Enterococcus sp. MMGLQ5-2]